MSRLQIDVFIMKIMNYIKCSKILNTSCLPKRPRQTGQTQIRLLLKKQSDLGLPSLLQMYSDKHFVNPALITSVVFEKRMRKVFKKYNIYLKGYSRKKHLGGGGEEGTFFLPNHPWNSISSDTNHPWNSISSDTNHPCNQNVPYTNYP